MKQPTAPEPIYPVLPTDGENYRLQEVSQLKKYLETERQKRAELYKKYKRGVNIVDGIDAALVVVALGVGAGGIGLLTTIVATPIVIGLEATALVCGLLGVSSKFISRRLTIKAKKHDEIRVLADSKLNTISDLISTALTDGKISDDEFRLILNEIEKYKQMKTEIRSNSHKKYMDKKTKNELIQQGKKEARQSFIEKLS